MELPPGHSVRYRHLRYTDGPLGPVLQTTGQARFLSEYVILPYGGVTIAIIRLTDDRTGQVLARGEAYCSARDNYCKATGRAIALGRAIKDLDRG